MAWIEIGSASDELFRTRGDVCSTYYSIRISPLSITLFSLKTSNQPWIFEYLNSNYFIPNEQMNACLSMDKLWMMVNNVVH